MRKKLTRELIEGLVAKEKSDLFVWDTTVMGLGVRVKPSGSKSYIVQYRQGGGRHSKSVRLTIDNLSSITLDDARKAARTILGDVAKGGDPRSERRAEAAVQERRVDKVIDAYDKDFKRRKVAPRHRTNSISVLRRGLSKHLKRDVSEISRQEFVAAIDAIKTPGAQQAFRQRLTPLLNFAVNQGLSPHNVLAGWRRPRRSRSVALTRNGRSLEAQEIKAIWAATQIPTPFNGLVRVMLLTGLRNAEAAALDWRWVDTAKGAITLPPERMKSGRVHAIPIVPVLAELLANMPRVPNSHLVFPVRSKSKTWTTMSGFGQMLRKLRKESNTDDWTLYDLRRTFRSMLADLGFDMDLCERMIAHSRGGLVERYDRSSRWPERVEAAKSYAEWVLASAADTNRSSNVVTNDSAKATSIENIEKIQ